MRLTDMVQAFGTFVASVLPANNPPRPLEIDLDAMPSAEERAVIGRWETADGGIQLKLLPNGRYDKVRDSHQNSHRGRYEVDGSRLYFEDDSGLTAIGETRYGVLNLGNHRFHRQASRALS